MKWHTSWETKWGTVGDIGDKVGDKAGDTTGDTREYKNIQSGRQIYQNLKQVGDKVGDKAGANRRTKGDTQWNSGRHQSRRQVGKQSQWEIK